MLDNYAKLCYIIAKLNMCLAKTARRFQADVQEVKEMHEKDSRIKEEDRTQCPVCGRDVSSKWNYCPKCGALLIKQKS